MNGLEVYGAALHYDDRPPRSVGTHNGSIIYTEFNYAEQILLVVANFQCVTATNRMAPRLGRCLARGLARGLERNLEQPRHPNDGLGAASVGSLADPNSALDLNALSQLSVIALVGLAFEARIAAGPGVLVACRGRETADLLRLALGAGCRSIISFGVGGGLEPDLLPGDCVVASAIIDYPAVRPT